MAFPTTPDQGDQYTHPVTGRIYTFFDGAWFGGLVDITIQGGGGGEVPTINNIGDVTTTVSINLTLARTHRIRLTSASCAITLSGTPAAGEELDNIIRIVHDNTANSRVVTWANAPHWPNETAPFLPTVDANAMCSVQIITDSDGTRWGWPTGSHFP